MVKKKMSGIGAILGRERYEEITHVSLPPGDVCLGGGKSGERRNTGSGERHILSAYPLFGETRLLLLSVVWVGK